MEQSWRLVFFAQPCCCCYRPTLRDWGQTGTIHGNYMVWQRAVSSRTNSQRSSKPPRLSKSQPITESLEQGEGPSLPGCFCPVHARTHDADSLDGSFGPKDLQLCTTRSPPYSTGTALDIYCVVAALQISSSTSISQRQEIRQIQHQHHLNLTRRSPPDHKHMSTERARKEIKRFPLPAWLCYLPPQ